jgi:hypothetical protein
METLAFFAAMHGVLRGRPRPIVATRQNQGPVFKTPQVGCPLTCFASYSPCSSDVYQGIAGRLDLSITHTPPPPHPNQQLGLQVALTAGAFKLGPVSASPRRQLLGLPRVPEVESVETEAAHRGVEMRWVSRARILVLTSSLTPPH